MLYQIENPIQGLVIKRPSLHCKTPYVSDIILEDNNDTQILGHSPSLGCCGLADKEATVVLSRIDNKKTKCSHRVELSLYKENNLQIYVGINPKLGEYIAEKALLMGFMQGLSNIKKYAREKTIMNSRFDFIGLDENRRPFILEIKNVPLADYVDVPKKDRKKYKDEIKNKNFHDKIAYFPDGYRKNNTDVVSPRALKHIQELEKIAKTSETRAILCFIIQRSDASCFQPSNIDLTYKKAVQSAWLNGVEIKTLQVEWNKQGTCNFVRNNLPIYLFDFCGPYQI
jgi:sugar fermentation stimulation protein A